MSVLTTSSGTSDNGRRLADCIAVCQNLFLLAIQSATVFNPIKFLKMLSAWKKKLQMQDVSTLSDTTFKNLDASMTMNDNFFLVFVKKNFFSISDFPYSFKICFVVYTTLPYCRFEQYQNFDSRCLVGTSLIFTYFIGKFVIRQFSPVFPISWKCTNIS